MDRIFVFDNGKVVEEGTHEHLLANGKVYGKSNKGFYHISGILF